MAGSSQSGGSGNGNGGNNSGASIPRVGSLLHSVAVQGLSPEDKVVFSKVAKKDKGTMVKGLRAIGPLFYTAADHVAASKSTTSSKTTTKVTASSGVRIHKDKASAKARMEALLAALPKACSLGHHLHETTLFGRQVLAAAGAGNLADARSFVWWWVKAIWWLWRLYRRHDGQCAQSLDVACVEHRKIVSAPSH